MEKNDFDMAFIGSFTVTRTSRSRPKNEPHAVQVLAFPRELPTLDWYPDAQHEQDEIDWLRRRQAESVV